jgi:hypothetical protein
MQMTEKELLARSTAQKAQIRAGAGSGEQHPGLFISWLAMLLPLGWLWFRLIDNLRVEWSSNPQYGYGWVVPFLCVGLICQRWSSLRSAFALKLGGDSPVAPKGGGVILVGFMLLAFLYLPTRLIGEATPEWRVIQWALGFETVGLTLCTIYLAFGGPCLSRCLFPIYSDRNSLADADRGACHPVTDPTELRDGS